MTDHQSAVLGAAEGTGAEIAWVVVSILCWILMVAPFALWWAGVRTPRSERRAVADPSETADRTTVGIEKDAGRTRVAR